MPFYIVFIDYLITKVAIGSMVVLNREIKLNKKMSLRCGETKKKEVGVDRGNSSVN
jgi:hypothetical protein